MAAMATLSVTPVTDAEKEQATTAGWGKRGIYIGTISHPQITLANAEVLRFVLYRETEKADGPELAGFVFYNQDDEGNPANHYLLGCLTPPPPGFAIKLFPQYADITDPATLEARLRLVLRSIYPRYLPVHRGLIVNGHIADDGSPVIEGVATKALFD